MRCTLCPDMSYDTKGYQNRITSLFYLSARRTCDAVAWISEPGWVAEAPRDSIAANGVAVEDIGDPLAVVWKWCSVDGFSIKIRRNKSKVSTESFPSEEAHARMAPSSWGAEEIELTTQFQRVR